MSIEKIGNQVHLWNKQHKEREAEHTKLENTPNIFALTALGFVPENGKVLEIGAGNGRDARYFIKNRNCTVIATDFSENAIRMMKAAALKDGTEKNLVPTLVDTRNIQDLDKESLDLFYARSSLHLSDSELYTLFEKVMPALKSGAYVLIEGKTSKDLKISRSMAIDKNLLEDIDGHLRRSWSSDFIQDFCLKTGLELIKVSETTEFCDKKECHFISFVARKK